MPLSRSPRTAFPSNPNQPWVALAPRDESSDAPLGLALSFPPHLPPSNLPRLPFPHLLSPRPLPLTFSPPRRTATAAGAQLMGGAGGACAEGCVDGFIKNGGCGALETGDQETIEALIPADKNCMENGMASRTKIRSDGALPSPPPPPLSPRPAPCLAHNHTHASARSLSLSYIHPSPTPVQACATDAFAGCDMAMPDFDMSEDIPDDYMPPMDGTYGGMPDMPGMDGTYGGGMPPMPPMGDMMPPTGKGSCAGQLHHPPPGSLSLTHKRTRTLLPPPPLPSHFRPGNCGGNGGGCWCDSVCTQYGDW